jgi:tetratricopeptide (TPR) repeat protein
MNRYESAKDKTRDGAFHFAQGDFEESIRYFTSAIKKDPKSHMAVLSRGAAYVKEDRIDEARSDFERAVKLNPRDAKSHHFLGLTFLHHGDQESARREFDRAIELSPGYGIAYFSRGTVRSEMGDLDGGGNDMTTAARIGEANLQAFSDAHNIQRTKYDKVVAELSGEREADIAVKPDLTAWGG